MEKARKEKDSASLSRVERLAVSGMAGLAVAATIAFGVKTGSDQRQRLESAVIFDAAVGDAFNLAKQVANGAHDADVYTDSYQSKYGLPRQESLMYLDASSGDYMGATYNTASHEVTVFASDCGCNGEESSPDVRLRFSIPENRQAQMADGLNIDDLQAAFEDPEVQLAEINVSIWKLNGYSKSRVVMAAAARASTGTVDSLETSSLYIQDGCVRTTPSSKNATDVIADFEAAIPTLGS